MDNKLSHEDEFPRCLVINNINKDTEPSEILSKINYGSIESFSITNHSATVVFFSYLDLYLSVKDIQAKDLFTDISIHPLPIKYNIKNSHLLGATRCISINDSKDKLNSYHETALIHGNIEKIYYEEPNIVIHFLNIDSAIKFVKNHLNNATAKNKISFRDDPCSKMKYLNNSFLDNSFYIKNRTIYLGGIQPDMTAEDIFNIIKGGDVLSLKIIIEKRCGFIDFVSYHSANVFLAYYTLNECIINKKCYETGELKQYKLKVSRGKETVLPVSTVLQAYQGTRRAILLCNKNNDLTKEKIIEDFSPFGEIELINFIKGKNIVFVNFISMNDAYNVYENYKNNDFYRIKHRMTFGRDRCSNESLEDVMKLVVKKIGPSSKKE